MTGGLRLSGRSAGIPRSRSRRSPCLTLSVSYAQLRQSLRKGSDWYHVESTDTLRHRAAEFVKTPLLCIPVKLQRTPAAYHSTEQSEMDGPPFLVSLRVLAHDHEKSILGIYTDTFLCAQAVTTWQAMIEQGRSCLLLIIDGSIDNAIEPIHHFF